MVIIIDMNTETAFEHLSTRYGFELPHDTSAAREACIRSEAVRLAEEAIGLGGPCGGNEVDLATTGHRLAHVVWLLLMGSEPLPGAK